MAQAATALIPLADGSEDIEAVTLIDVLRRAGIQVTVASLEPGREVVCARGTRIVADLLFTELGGQPFDAICCPGGKAGAEALGRHAGLIARLKEQRTAHRWIAGICAAPALALSPHGLLDGKQATCYPAFKDRLLHWVDRPVVVDGHCVTSQGPATALVFALTLVELLAGAPLREQIARDMLAA